MPSLKKPNINADPNKHWPLYAMREMQSYVLKDFFLVSSYRTCIENARDYYKQQKEKLEFVEDIRGSELPNRDFVLAQAKGVVDWTLEMESEEYHDLYVHAFIGMWSSFEAGLENIFKDYIKNDLNSANTIISNFKHGKYNIDTWPWNDDKCFEIASNLEKRVRQIHTDENLGVDFYQRIKIIFSWFEIEYKNTEKDRYYLNEANRVRNILLHRNGIADKQDIVDFAELSEYQNKAIHFTEERFKNYYNGIMNTMIEIWSGITVKVSKEQLIPGF